MSRLDVAKARRRLHQGGEIALLDVREAGQFGEGHALFAIPCPYSRLELRIGTLVPRLTAPVLLIDAGDGVSERAARRLAALGYGNVTAIDGGMPAWEAAGFPVYKGVNVPSKTLGELAEAIWHPAMITPERLADWKKEGHDFAFFDARPADEYAKMRVPGAACLPNGELAHRLPVAADVAKPVVITCAGRTRGIIGAIGVRLSGHEGEVLALENGTQGWALAGEALERGNRADPFPPLPPAGLAETRARADALMARFGIETIDAGGIRSLLADDTATTYLLDVRSAEEAAADPVPGAVHALSGQLVQATDQWVAVRHARLVLFDDAGLRAALAAFWLKQLGYRPYVARIDDAVRAMESTSKRRSPPLSLRDISPARGENDGARSRSAASAVAERHERDEASPQPLSPLAGEMSAQPTEGGPSPRLCSPIDPAAARDRVAGGSAVFVDLRSSLAYRGAHVEGALWLVRPRASKVADMVGSRAALLIADDPALAALAAQDLADAGVSDIRIVEGGHGALVRAGAPIVATSDQPADTEAIDHLFFVHDRHDGNLEASRRYLAWETGLIAQMDAVERDEFRLERP